MWFKLCREVGCGKKNLKFTRFMQNTFLDINILRSKPNDNNVMSTYHIAFIPVTTWIQSKAEVTLAKTVGVNSGLQPCSPQLTTPTKFHTPFPLLQTSGPPLNSVDKREKRGQLRKIGFRWTNRSKTWENRFKKCFYWQENYSRFQKF